MRNACNLPVSITLLLLVTEDIAKLVTVHVAH